MYRPHLSNMSARRDLTLIEKCDLLKQYDNLPRMSQAGAAQTLGIPQSTLSKLLKNRYKLETSLWSNDQPTRKRKRTGKDKDVENALKEWYISVCEKGARVSGPQMMQKAEEIGRQLGKEFQPTSGWFFRWKQRENITRVKSCGEGEVGVGEDEAVSADEWLCNVWPTIINEYSEADIYTADETALYYRAAPEHLWIFREENAEAKGVEAYKQRVTVLCCASMSGEKKELLVIGSRKNRSCFEGVKKLPVEYCSNSNAWMTSVIFSKWLKTWDEQLNRNIVLLIDTCIAHNCNVELENIKLVHLPANTSISLPCERGIIQTMKSHYRYQMCSRITNHFDEVYSIKDGFPDDDLAKKTSLLDALHLLVTAWKSVPESTIRNCFKRAGFVPKNHDTNEETTLPLPIPADMDSNLYEEWVNIDQNLSTSCLTEEDEFLLCADQINQSSDEIDDGIEPPPKPPSHQEMLKAIEVLSNGVQYYSDTFDLHNNYVKFILRMLEKNKEQK
ncbi:tigger transposable element-derived protein 6-like [Planococcus citri]|uniref:tigger transposable element-derived protein 6-like n=1 Tax=Planococcus citri TaxID=170843 RepID=UPI0031FA3BE7